MSTAEIIAELPRLSSEELAQVQAKLSELIALDSAQSRPTRVHPARIYSPRFVYPNQSKDFTKQVVELPPDAKL